jgi:spore coat protein CotH
MPRSLCPTALLAVSLACGDAGEATDDGSTTTTPPPQGGTTGPAPGTTGESTGEPTGGATTDEPAPPPDLPGAKCDPQGGTWWVLEGEPLSVPVTCGTGDDPGMFTVDPLPPGMTLGPGEIAWTPGLDQAATYTLTLTALGETAPLKIGVIDAWADPNNVPVVDPATYTEEYGLPVLHLRTAPGITDQFYTPATVTYRGHAYTAEAKHRGAASLGYPKKSFTLKFTKEDRFSEPAEAFTDKRKVVLITTFDDNAYVRQRLAYELWNRLDPGHIQIDTYSAVVFLDGAYWGLYTISDHVDRYLMEDHGLSEDGNLYKARTHDANFRLTRAFSDDPKGVPHEGLTKEEGLPEDGQPGAYDDLDELITWVATADDADFAAEIDARLDRRDYEDWWIFVTLIMGDDSAGKNSYHYRDPLGGPWRFAPWDFNDSFGQTWQTARKGWDAHPDDYVWANELHARLLASPQFGPPLRARYAAALAEVYAVDEVLARLDELAAEVRPSAHRDEQRWAAEYQSYGGWNWRADFLDHDAEMAYLQQWIADRWAFVAGLY